MGTTSWATARAEIASEFGFVAFTTTTPIAASNSVISLSLADEHITDDEFQGWYLLAKRGANAARRMVVTGYVAATGTLSVAGRVLAADTANVECELHKFSPWDLRTDFNTALRDLFPNVAVLRSYESIVTGPEQNRYTLPNSLTGKPVRVYLADRREAEGVAGNILNNPGFERWNGSAFDSWGVGSITVGRERASGDPPNYLVLHGEQSARLEVATNVTGTLTQRIGAADLPVSMEGVRANFSIWAYALSQAPLSAVLTAFVGTETTEAVGTSHMGLGWQLLRASLTTPADTDRLHAAVRLEGDSGPAICYVDEAVLVLGHVEEDDISEEALTRWEWLGPAPGASDNGVLITPFSLGSHRRLRVVGLGELSPVASDDDVIDMDGPPLQTLYDYVRQLTARRAANFGAVAEREGWVRVAGNLQNRVRRSLQDGKYVKTPARLIPERV